MMKMHWAPVVVAVVALVTAVVADVASLNMSCSGTATAYRLNRWENRGDLPQQPISGEKLSICGGGRMTCCTPAMENKLSDISDKQFQAILQESTGSLLNNFTSRARKFDEFFRELLENSKRDFHDMFKRTYGIIYEQNSEVFTDLFQDLEDYYSKGKLDLEEAMNHFFTTLYQRMFTVMNAQYPFDDKYLICVNTHMKELKPFGDVPKKLSMEVKRSFIATRTFTQALNTGRDVVTKMQSLNSSPECRAAVMRMSMCPVCSGLPELKPCRPFCLNVLKGCLAYHAELAIEWDNYIDALVKVSDRLLGVFNIELVVDPIDIKISDAVMNFQENGYEVSQKVFKGCGKPRLDKRSAPQMDFAPVKFDRRSGGGGGGGGVGGVGAVRPTTAAGTSLDRLVRDIKQKVKASKGFWTKLSQSVCSHDKMASPSSDDADCWNGSQRSRYSAMMGDGVNTEVSMDSRPNSLVNEQIFTLRLITNKLENAYNGMDVEWDDPWANGSGSGSGDGSGAGVDLEEDDDEDLVRAHHPSRGGGGGGGGNNAHRNNVDVEDVVSNPNPGNGPPHYDDSDDYVDKNDGDIEFTAVSTPATPVDDVNDVKSSANPAENPAPLTKTKALTSYLVPIVVMWIGNMF